LDDDSLRELNREGKSDVEIGRLVGLEKSVVSRRRKRLGLPTAPKHFRRALGLGEVMMGRLIGEGKSDAEIGRLCGMHQTTVSKRRRRWGISPVEWRKVRASGLDEDALRRLKGEGQSDLEIGKAYGISKQAVGHWRRRWRIGVLVKSSRIKLTDETLKEMVEEGKSDVEIGRILDVATTTVRVGRERFGIVSAMERWPTAMVFDEAMGL
jgi:DNA-binding CsgD family transcriptional regulator